MTRQRRRAGPAALAAVAAEWAQLRQWATSVTRHASVTLMELGTSTRVSLRCMSAKIDGKYREVQLDYTPEIEVFYMLLERCHTKIGRNL